MTSPHRRADLLAALPEARLARLQQVQAAAADLGLSVYLVGGVVRDLLLGLPPGDFDLVAVPAGAEQGAPPGPRLARALAQRHGGAVTVHPAFGTATWLAPDGAATDCATARTETYAQPGALPSVTPTPDITTDLARRDFTLNALALRVDGDHLGELVDPFGGQADLAACLVRALHPASLQDDPTRLFRAVRYARRLAFTLAPDTLAQVAPALAVLPALSGERLRHELDLIFAEPQAAAMLTQLDELGALTALHPALSWSPAAAERAAVLPELPRPAWQLPAALIRPAACFALLLAAAPGESAGALARLAITHDVAQAVTAALAFQPAAWPAQPLPSQVVAMLDRLPPAGVAAAYALHPAQRPLLHRYLSEWRFVRADLTGDDLLALGLPAGPRFKTLLWQLRAGRLDGTLSSRTAELAQARQWLRAQAD
ncbi:MAG: CCA tRNA nucleotidyltransferase [Anaerolineales bacterium]|nr:CCA tRNA nucleotidyltransferase [Anaerolineales bacterium]